MNEPLEFITPWVHTTERCNCRCPYCFVKRGPRDMTDEVYCRLNDVVVDAIRDGRLKGCTYRLGGGEPTLVIKKWYPHVDRYLSETEGPAFTVGLITNFVNYPEEIDDLMTRHPGRFSVAPSLDGMEMSQPDVNGRSTAEKTVGNILKFRERYPNQRMPLSTTITDNGAHLPGLGKFVADNNLMWGVGFDKTQPFDGNEVTLENLSRAIDIVYHATGTVDMINVNKSRASRGRARCAQGGAGFRLMPYGEIVNCESQEEVITNVWDDFLFTMANNDSRAKIADECDECYLWESCSGKCPAQPYDPVFCKAIKRMILKLKTFKLRELKTKEG